jgi:hypothetical protein
MYALIITAHTCLVPTAIGLSVLNASIYDVPYVERVALLNKHIQRTICSGGYRAVMFDRFSGVKNTVSDALTFLSAQLTNHTHRLHPKALIYWFHGCKKQFSSMSALNQKYA